MTKPVDAAGYAYEQRERFICDGCGWTSWDSGYENECLSCNGPMRSEQQWRKADPRV